MELTNFQRYLPHSEGDFVNNSPVNLGSWVVTTLNNKFEENKQLIQRDKLKGQERDNLFDKKSVITRGNAGSYQHRY